MIQIKRELVFYCKAKTEEEAEELYQHWLAKQAAYPTLDDIVITEGCEGPYDYLYADKYVDKPWTREEDSGE